MKTENVIAVILIPLAIASSVLTTHLLYGHVSFPVRQGIGWWVLMLAVYPSVRLILNNSKTTIGTNRRSLSFVKWILIFTPLAVMVGITTALSL
jgi:hypothetical protein